MDLGTFANFLLCGFSQIGAIGTFIVQWPRFVSIDEIRRIHAGDITRRSFFPIGFYELLRGLGLWTMRFSFPGSFIL